MNIVANLARFQFHMRREYGGQIIDVSSEVDSLSVGAPVSFELRHLEEPSSYTYRAQKVGRDLFSFYQLGDLPVAPYPPIKIAGSGHDIDHIDDELKYVIGLQLFAYNHYNHPEDGLCSLGRVINLSTNLGAESRRPRHVLHSDES